MKNQSLFIVAAVAAAAAATATIVVSNRSSVQTAKASEASPLFPGLREKVEDVAKIKVRRGTVDVTLAKVPGEKLAWVAESRANYPVEFEHVRQAIAGLAEAKIIETKTSKPEFYERLGVGDVEKPGSPGTRIELDDASGKVIAAVIVGNSSREGAGENEPGGSKPRYFVRRDGDAQTYLAKGDLSVQAEPMSWLNRAIVEVDGTKVKSVTVTHNPADGTPETYTVGRNTAAEQKFTLENLPAGRQLKDENKIATLGQAFSNFAMDDVTAVTGLDFSKPEAVIEARLFDGEAITAKMVTKDGKKWFAFEASYEEPPGTGAPADAPKADEAPKADAPLAAPDAKPDAKPEAKPDAPKSAEDLAKEAGEKAKTEAAKAQAEEKAAVMKRVAETNEKCGPWAYALPEYKVTQMLTKLEDLLKPAEVPPPVAPTAPVAPPAPTPDTGLLQSPH